MIYPQASAPRNARVLPKQEIESDEFRDGANAVEKATDTDIPVRRPLHHWLDNRQDYIHYWISHGGSTSPIPRTYQHATNHNGRSYEATASSRDIWRKADSVIHSASSSQPEIITHISDNPVSNLLERAVNIRQRLEDISTVDGTTTDAVNSCLVAIQQDIRSLLVDITRSVPRQQPQPDPSSRVQGGRPPQQRSSGTLNTKTIQLKGKQPVRDTNVVLGSGPGPSVKVCTPSNKAKRLHVRCIYCFAANQSHRCPATKPFMRDLMSV